MLFDQRYNQLGLTGAQDTRIFVARGRAFAYGEMGRVAIARDVISGVTWEDGEGNTTNPRANIVGVGATASPGHIFAICVEANGVADGKAGRFCLSGVIPNVPLVGGSNGAVAANAPLYAGYSATAATAAKPTLVAPTGNAKVIGVLDAGVTVASNAATGTIVFSGVHPLGHTFTA